MANRNIKTSLVMREWTQRAKEEGVRTPAGLFAFFEDNGWEGEIPSYPTREKLLKECGLVYVRGRWMLSDE